MAQHAERFYNQKVDAGNRGSDNLRRTEAVFAAILGLTDPGDEVMS